MNSSYQVEKITPNSCDSTFSQIARLHQQEIGQGFLSSLGPKFLERLYRAIVRSPHAFILTATRDEKVLGFLCGSTNTKKVYRHFLLTGGLRAAFTLLPKMLSPEKLRRVVETLFYPTRHQELQLPSAEILNFCVDQNCQRLGIGKQLFGGLTAEFRDRGIESIRIVTGDKQVSAQRFYESLGAARHSDLEIHAGDQSLVYTYDIANKTRSTHSRAA